MIKTETQRPEGLRERERERDPASMLQREKVY